MLMCRLTTALMVMEGSLLSRSNETDQTESRQQLRLLILCCHCRPYFLLAGPPEAASGGKRGQAGRPRQAQAASEAQAREMAKIHVRASGLRRPAEPLLHRPGPGCRNQGLAGCELTSLASPRFGFCDSAPARHSIISKFGCGKACSMVAVSADQSPKVSTLNGAA